LRSAPALTGGSETLPPHIRSRSGSRDSKALFTPEITNLLSKRNQASKQRNTQRRDLSLQMNKTIRA
jgi:hypothetical protein